MNFGKGIFGFTLGSVICSLAGAQSTIFDNTTHSLSNNMNMLPAGVADSVEVGDEVWLDGQDRVGTELTILLNHRGSLSGSFDARIRFRTVDEETQTPGDIFYDSGVIANLSIVGGINEYTFSLPDVELPDRMVWTIQGFNRQGAEGEFGPAYYNPATVGASDDFFWLASSSTEWIAYNWGGDPYANFAARITAVPEPATFVALAAGLGLIARRRKKSSR